MNTDLFPSINEQGKNLAKFTFDVVKNVVNISTPVFVSEDKQKERMEICKQCDYYSNQKRCKKCGCFLSHKVLFEVSKCPINKW